MKILYCDVQLGASGDMLVGAFLDMGLPVNVLTTQLQSLSVKGFAIVPEKVKRYGIQGTQAGITTRIDTTNRNLAAVNDIIAHTTCSDTVKKNAMKVFDTISRC